MARRDPPPSQRMPSVPLELEFGSLSARALFGDYDRHLITTSRPTFYFRTGQSRAIEGDADAASAPANAFVLQRSAQGPTSMRKRSMPCWMRSSPPRRIGPKSRFPAARHDPHSQEEIVRLDDPTPT